MSPSKGVLHATVTQVEPDLFRAEYSAELNPENPDEREFPDAHIATTAQAVKIWVEQMATSLGYERVVWDQRSGESGEDGSVPSPRSALPPGPKIPTQGAKPAG